ncbi:hypothetical protein FED53_10425 [Priestia flexa]|nr:hypothetical protein FED53_10425 [Priestia flexa]
MSCKIIFFDVDGTLTHHKSGEIPESTKRAISLLRNLGIIIVAATPTLYVRRIKRVRY